MKPQIAPFSIATIIFGLSVQFLLSHGAAALAALWVANWPGGGWPLALITALIIGLILTLPLTRTLRQTAAALAQLGAGRTPEPLSRRGHGPLAELVTHLNALIIHAGEAADLRETWLVQAHAAAAQQERNRLARDLHDSIKQQLFSISLSATAAQTRWEQDPPATQAALADVRRSALEAMAEMNALLQQLAPAPLEQVGLVQALRDQCEALGYRAGVEVAVEFGALPTGAYLPPGTEESLFRIAQETLSNISRHARARRVRLYLGQRTAGGPVALEIADDGKSFEVDSTTCGMGLANIRERARALGSTLEITSAPGQGTTLRLCVPLILPPEAQEDAMYKPDHTFNKTFLAGLLGGLALIVTLYYPLYVLLPAAYVSDWPQGQPAAGLICQAGAILLVAATGYLAARWTKPGARASQMLLGALAGGFAGVIAYLGLGAAAAGVVGHAAVLQYGARPAPDTLLIQLIVESLRQTIQMSYGIFWLTLLAGTGLGALGGALAPRWAAAQPPELRYSGRVVLTALMLGSALTLALSTLFLWNLEPTIYRSLAKSLVILGPGPAIATITLWPIVTPLISYLASFIGLYLLARADSRQADPLRLATLPMRTYGYAALAWSGAALTIIFLLISSRETSAAWPLMVEIFANLILGGLFMALARQAAQKLRAAGQVQLPGGLPAALTIVIFATGLIPASLWGAAVMLKPFSVEVASLLSLVIIISGDLAISLAAWRQWQKLDAAFRIRQQMALMQDYANALSGAATAAFFLSPMLAVSLVVSVITLIITLIASLAATASQPYQSSLTLAQLVQQLYLYQAQALLIGFALAAAGAGLGGLLSIFRRRAQQKTETV